MQNDVEVVVHPLVLLSILDHFQRVNRKRVAGIILGYKSTQVHITNSFAVPFEEDEETGVWFFDTSYQKTMYDLFNRIQSTEKILGWYHTGVGVQKTDIQITDSLKNMVDSPMLLIVDVLSASKNFPVEVFQTRDNDFFNLKICIEAEEAEEVGVEHLIRDIKTSSNDKKIKLKESLCTYEQNIDCIVRYIEDVLTGKAVKNYSILAFLQECLNEIPKIPDNHDENSIECYSAELTKSIVLINDLEINRRENKAL